MVINEKWRLQSSNFRHAIIYMSVCRWFAYSSTLYNRQISDCFLTLRLNLLWFRYILGQYHGEADNTNTHTHTHTRVAQCGAPCCSWRCLLAPTWHLTQREAQLLSAKDCVNQVSWEFSPSSLSFPDGFLIDGVIISDVIMIIHV